MVGYLLRYRPILLGDKILCINLSNDAFLTEQLTYIQPRIIFMAVNYNGLM
jgi:hypothetical protein